MSDQKKARTAADMELGPMFTRVQNTLDDVGVILLAAAVLILTLGMAGWTRGLVIDPIVNALWRWLGLGAIIVPAGLAYLTYRLARRALGKPTPLRYSRLIALELLFLALLGLLSALAGTTLASAEQGWGGGIIGWGLAVLVTDLLGSFGAGIVFAALVLLLAAYVALDIVRRRGSLRQAVEKIQQVEEEVGRSVEAAGTRNGARRRRRGGRLPSEFRKQFEMPDASDDRIEVELSRQSELPPLELLETGGAQRITSKEINRTAGLIEKTLADFGIPARVVDFRAGPSVTQFAVEPGYLEQTGSGGDSKRAKVRVSQISGLANDLALALSAPRLRIEAPVPGQPYVGVEVPNQRGSVVRLRPLLESEAFNRIESPLAIALGRNVAGVSVAADLAAMPHLLIAGTTGSGKSVAITAIATCLAMNNTPDELRMVMVDPKMVELLRFNGLPHLLGKVETDLERIVGVLRWCTLEMDRRYRLLEKAEARDIDGYNRRVAKRRGEDRLPRVVVLLDELADLMMMAPDQTERTLVRLAQMARAVGIHLVVATQRPSTDIVTGLIKANFPARMSFATASGTDSRVILDTPGAETLLGKGDMLYLSPEASAPVRIQGVFVSDQEVARLIEFWQRTELQVVEEEEDPPWEEHLARQEVLEEHDDMIQQAIEVVTEEGEASASLLQRRLRVGYPRAARLMDELEELGVVGRPQSGGKTREVLISESEDPFDEPDLDDSS
ncbi:MAG: DNA translocase FtsK [Anaerolineales bacterium]